MVQNRPTDQRLILVLMNNTGRSQTATITYPHEAHPTGIAPEVAASVALAPHGTGLYEISMPEALGERIASRPFWVRTEAERASRIYLNCATPALDRFSIDHR